MKNKTLTLLLLTSLTTSIKLTAQNSVVIEQAQVGDPDAIETPILNSTTQYYSINNFKTVEKEITTKPTNENYFFNLFYEKLALLISARVFSVLNYESLSFGNNFYLQKTNFGEKNEFKSDIYSNSEIKNELPYKSFLLTSGYK